MQLGSLETYSGKIVALSAEPQNCAIPRAVPLGDLDHHDCNAASSSGSESDSEKNTKRYPMPSPIKAGNKRVRMTLHFFSTESHKRLPKFKRYYNISACIGLSLDNAF